MVRFIRLRFFHPLQSNTLQRGYYVARNGSYNGGSTVIGARSGWFSFKEKKGDRNHRRRFGGRFPKSKNKKGALSKETNSDLNGRADQVDAEPNTSGSNTGPHKHRVAVVWQGDRYVKAPEQNDTSPTPRTKKSRY
tara:strand:- start:10532 stop:10939 length:408 start_codon:yes stop_codon:yes gene_type:complete